jgi:hypothetical protein
MEIFATGIVNGAANTYVCFAGSYLVYTFAGIAPNLGIFFFSSCKDCILDCLSNR